MCFGELVYEVVLSTFVRRNHRKLLGHRAEVKSSVAYLFYRFELGELVFDRVSLWGVRLGCALESGHLKL